MMTTPYYPWRNINTMRLFCSFLLALFCVLFTPCVFSAGHPPTTTAEGKIIVRKFDENALNAYRADKDFNYNNDVSSVAPSIWGRFWNWFWSLFGDIRGKVSAALSFWQYFMLSLLTGIIIFFVIKLTGMDVSLLFSGKPAQTVIPYAETGEDIHIISFEEEIAKAVALQNYRVAVRLLYLKSLKRLSDSGRIRWEPGKTNSAYVNELKNVLQKQKFSILTRDFEYIWYGDFPLNSTAFELIQNDFREFNREAFK